ncbi:hypothetical protein, partial [Listeria seeligeri]|uniref:hypothetical protein n=1 Tax=Listeria seeligeri TaxID=1640 RepID=UPI0022EBE18E
LQFEFLVRLDNMYVLSLENTSKFILLNLRCSFLIVSNYSGSSDSGIKKGRELRIYSGYM